MQWIKCAWRGEEKLWKVFWIYWVLGISIGPTALGVLIGVTGGIIMMLLAFIAGQNAMLIFLVFLIFLAAIFCFAYTVWVLISSWRCAFNTAWKFWGYAVRVLICFWWPLLVIVAISVPLLGAQELVNYGKCRHMLMDKAAQEGIDYTAYVQQHPEEKQKCMPNDIKTTP